MHSNTSRVHLFFLIFLLLGLAQITLSSASAQTPPVAPLDPVSWLAQHPEIRPREVTLVRNVSLPTLIPGKAFGTIDLKKGLKAIVTSITPTQVMVQTTVSANPLALNIADTDLLDQATALMPKPAALAASGAEIYTFPTNAPQSPNFTATADGQPLFVYESEVAAIATLGIKSKTEIRIKPTAPFRDVVIRPLSKGIKPVVLNGEIIFTLNTPQNLIVELDGKHEHPLFLFANPPEQLPKNIHDSNLIYFAPGETHYPGFITPKSNQTVYLAGGAIVHGLIRVENAEHVRILGPGILAGPSAEEFTDRKTHGNMIMCDNVKNLEIKDLLLTYGGGSWTVHLIRSSGISIDNMKIAVTKTRSADGIDVDSCSGVTLSGCFIRCGDDKICLKTYGNVRDANKKNYYNVPNPNIAENITAERCTLYGPNRDFEIGFELNGDAIRNVLFRDSDVIHGTVQLFSVHNGGRCVVDGVRVENIRVEDPPSNLLEFRLGLSGYSLDHPSAYHGVPPEKMPQGVFEPHDGGTWYRWSLTAPTPFLEEHNFYAPNRGFIRNIAVSNIQISEAKHPQDLIVIGYNDQHSIENVSIQKISEDGQPLKEWDPKRLKIRNAKNVQILDTSSALAK